MESGPFSTLEAESTASTLAIDDALIWVPACTADRDRPAAEVEVLVAEAGVFAIGNHHLITSDRRVDCSLYGRILARGREGCRQSHLQRPTEGPTSQQEQQRASFLILPRRDGG